MGDMADMVNNDYIPNDGQDQHQDDIYFNNTTMDKKLEHDFAVVSVKTANSSGSKYLGKNGEQAYRVSTKIGEDWFANMIYDETLVPKKGTKYTISLTDDGEWKNWDYTVMSKKEQIQQQTQPETPMDNIPPPITEEMLSESTPSTVATTPTFEHVKDNRELSIVTQSILHINGYYITDLSKDPVDNFVQNAERAKNDAKWFLEYINNQ